MDDINTNTILYGDANGANGQFDKRTPTPTRATLLSSQTDAQAPQSCERFTIGEFVIDPVEGSVTAPDGEISFLEPMAVSVLLRLAQHPDHLVTRRQLLDDIWYPGADCDSALTRTISILRRALGDTDRPPRIIQTIHKRGYRLLQPVRHHPEAVVPQASAQVGADPRTDLAPEQFEPSSDGPSFLHELKRRRVFRVASAYIVAGWIIMQVGETTFAPLGIPPWCLTVLMLLVIFGFPMAVALAWAIQLTPRGAMLDTPVKAFSEKATRSLRMRFRYLLLGLVVAGSGVVAYTYAANEGDDIELPSCVSEEHGTALAESR